MVEIYQKILQILIERKQRNVLNYALVSSRQLFTEGLLLLSGCGAIEDRFATVHQGDLWK